MHIELKLALALATVVAVGCGSKSPPHLCGSGNTAVKGESTPPAGDGFTSETSATYGNVSGLNAALH